MKDARWLLMALLPVALAVGVGLLGAYLLRRFWHTDEIAARMVVANAVTGYEYDSSVNLVASKTGAPAFYVRWVAPKPALKAPCVEVRKNPAKTINRVFGYVGGGIMSVIPFTAPFGVATLAAASAIDAALPPTVVRPCR